LLVDLADRTAPIVSFRPLAPVRWDTLTVDRLDTVTSLDELERHIQVAWTARRGADPGTTGTEWMVRVVLVGPCPLWAELRTGEDQELLAGELRSLLGALDATVITDGVHPVVPIEEHRARTDVLGEVLRLSDTIRRGERTLTTLDPSTLVGVTSDDPVVVAAYVRGLLVDADGELAAHLLEDAES
jgi:hypothetical protein